MRRLEGYPGKTRSETEEEVSTGYRHSTSLKPTYLDSEEISATVTEYTGRKMVNADNRSKIEGDGVHVAMCETGITRSANWRDWYQNMCEACSKKEQIAAKKASEEGGDEV